MQENDDDIKYSAIVANVNFLILRKSLLSVYKVSYQPFLHLRDSQRFAHADVNDIIDGWSDWWWKTKLAPVLYKYPFYNLMSPISFCVIVYNSITLSLC